MEQITFVPGSSFSVEIKIVLRGFSLDSVRSVQMFRMKCGEVMKNSVLHNKLEYCGHFGGGEWTGLSLVLLIGVREAEGGGVCL